MEDVQMPLDISLPSAPAAEGHVPLTISVSPKNNDDTDEWEYEYSTSETEVQRPLPTRRKTANRVFQTFYVTLDLTIPDMLKHRRTGDLGRPKNPIWANPGLGRNKRRGALGAPMTYKVVDSREGSPVQNPAGADEAQNSSAEADGRGDEIEDDQDDDPSTPATQGNTETPFEDIKLKESSRVQILDLHTENPIVSYDGQVYSCEWAQNIGTEMIFISGESAVGLPALRNLSDGTVLLAASSARIISKPVTLEPKANPNEEDTSKKRSNPPGKRAIGDYQIPGKSNSSRDSQSKFLQRMIAVKKAKGEEDAVTLKVELRKTNRMWKKEWQGFVAKERSRLNRIIAHGHGDEVGEARRTLEELDIQVDLAVTGKGKQRNKNEMARNRAGRKRKIRFDLSSKKADGNGTDIPTSGRRADMEAEDVGNKGTGGVLNGHLEGYEDVDPSSGEDDEDDNLIQDS